MIEAAGGVIVDLTRGKPRYLLIHRPLYDDWTFPKGKLDTGEKYRDAALREVKEETGLTCEVLARLSSTEYVTSGNNTKKVRYWLMRPMSGSFSRNDEVDAVTWLKRSPAMSLLTHVHDQAVLAEAHVVIKNLRRLAEDDDPAQEDDPAQDGPAPQGDPVRDGAAQDGPVPQDDPAGDGAAQDGPAREDDPATEDAAREDPAQQDSVGL